MFDVTVNFWAVVAAAVTSFIVGSVWYSPMMFGDVWARNLGKSPGELERMKKAPMATPVVGMFVGSLVMAYILAHFVTYLNVRSLADAFLLAFWLWLGFIVTVSISAVLFEHRSKKVFFINIAFQLVNLFVASVILGLWR
ncbi:MAG: DUF1761 domain-containing protein [bacterium]|nr:DUF1761 domain-containing protein [bacterium]MDZ4299689.1 DUF1761 domain-containing protein [Candidatus Sungbacteria bacterium]